MSRSAGGGRARRSFGGAAPLPVGAKPPFAGKRLPSEDFSSGRARRNSFRQEVRRREGLPASPPFSGSGRADPLLLPPLSSPFPGSHGAESECENVFPPPYRLHIIQIFEENQEEIITSFSAAFVRIYKKCTFHIFSVFDVPPLRVVCFLRQATPPVFTAF